MALRTNGSANWARRQYRYLFPRRGSPARGWDRIEAAVMLAVLLLILAAVPVSALAGSVLHDREMRVVNVQRTERHQVTAVLLAPSPPDMLSESGTVEANTETVAAKWTLPDGTERSGPVQAESGLAVGATVPIWLDGAGNVVSAPMSAANATGLAVGFGALLFSGATMTFLLMYWATRSILDRLRAAAWAREWASVQWGPRSKGDSK